MTRKITIHPVLNGYVVGVGCQSVCFNTIEQVCEHLRNYAKSVPAGYEAGFISSAVNKDLVEGPCNPIENRIPAQDVLSVPAGCGSTTCVQAEQQVVTTDAPRITPPRR